ncbi:hypothetical protein ACVIIV_005711 [Bradyrhizobium sp. USDA 4354]
MIQTLQINRAVHYGRQNQFRCQNTGFSSSLPRPFAGGHHRGIPADGDRDQPGRRRRIGPDRPSQNEQAGALQRGRLPVSRGIAGFSCPGQVSTTLGYFGTIAGNCFRTGTQTVFSRAQGGEFYGDSPIQNMVCFPIKLGPSRSPFGVACFHNNIPEKAFSPEDLRVLEAYTDILALALHTPHPELQLDRNVFIVHGRDERSRISLESILRQNKVNPKVLLREDKNATTILSALEELIRTCKAGFILATPDDEGRLGKPNEQLAARARENVIFEMGMLFAKFRAFDRVAILLKKPLRLPSDLNGVTYEEFERIEDIEATVVRKLDSWKLLS